MPNLARKWFKAKGYKWSDLSPEKRKENIARSLAAEPTPEARAARTERLRKLHGDAVADDIVERAREIYHQRKRRRKR